MILDGHMHSMGDGKVNSKVLDERMKIAGVDGGIILSQPPNSFIRNGQTHKTEERLDNLFLWAESNHNIYPFFWIDPLEGDAIEQVDNANKRGVRGFKVICNRFFPSDNNSP